MYKIFLKNFIFIIIFIGILNLFFPIFRKLFILLFRNSFFKNNLEYFTTLNTMADSFCKNAEKSQIGLDAKCQKLTEQNCNSTSCCVWLNGEKCVAGGIKGPTFNTDENGKTKEIDNYYYQNKCYGPKC